MAKYSLVEFKDLISHGNLSYLNENRAFKNLDKLSWSKEYFVELLLQLKESDFQKTVPNCKINDHPFLDIVDGDQYEIHWDEENEVRHETMNNMTISLSLKIAIVKEISGNIAGVVTFHMSGSQG